MTTIAIAWTPKVLYIAADSGITDGNFATMPSMEKIVRQNDWLIAGAGLDRTTDVLQLVTKYPSIPPRLKRNRTNEAWLQWMAKRIVPKIRKTAQDEMSLDTKDGVAEIPDSDFIYISHGKGFLISASLGITLIEPYWAIGSGSQLAIGSLATSYDNKDWDKKAKDYLVQALKTAIRHDSFSHPPITMWASHTTGGITKCDSKDLV